MYNVGARHNGRHILFSVVVLPLTPANDLTSVKATALLDTGATGSGLTPRVVEKLGLEPWGKRLLGSARNEEYTPRYLFRIGIEPEGETPQFPFIFNDIDGFELRNSFEFDVLIGMDVLRQCDFAMRRDGQWSLSFG